MVEEIRGILGDDLENKRIIHCITSSASIYRAPDIARFLIKHGANVIPVLSYKASKLISPDIFEYATGNKPIFKITGKVEHVELFKQRVDAVLIAPATANTISKIANGISDNIVTLIASMALGKGVPLIIAPAMHEPMLYNQILMENIEKLKRKKVFFIEPIIEEGKAKIAEQEEILDALLYALKPKQLTGKKIVVTLGATKEKIDDVRFITNPSSGRMGLSMAMEAFYRGGNVHVISGAVNIALPRALKVEKVESAEEMLKVSLELASDADYFVSAAGVTDYKPERVYEGKIETKKFEKIELRLVQTPKIIKEVKKINPRIKLISFKAEYGLNEERIKEIAEEYSFSDYIIFNDISRKDVGFESEYNEVFFYDKNKIIKIDKARKRKIASKIWDLILG